MKHQKELYLILEKLKSEYPNNDQLHAWIGWVYRRMGQFEKAFEYMNRAISLNPSGWESWWSAGATLTMLGRYTQAEEYIKTSIDLNPSEKRKFIWLVAEYFFLVENLYRQREMNLVSDQTWIQHSKAAAGLLNHPILTSWWNSGVSPYSMEFIAAIDIASRELGEAVWSYTPLSEL